MICRKCGRHISDDAKFCTFCGTKQEIPEVEEEEILEREVIDRDFKEEETHTQKDQEKGEETFREEDVFVHEEKAKVNGFWGLVQKIGAWAYPWYEKLSNVSNIGLYFYFGLALVSVLLTSFLSMGAAFVPGLGALASIGFIWTLIVGLVVIGIGYLIERVIIGYASRKAGVVEDSRTLSLKVWMIFTVRTILNLIFQMKVIGNLLTLIITAMFAAGLYWKDAQVGKEKITFYKYLLIRVIIFVLFVLLFGGMVGCMLLSLKGVVDL